MNNLDPDHITKHGDQLIITVAICPNNQNYLRTLANGRKYLIFTWFQMHRYITLSLQFWKQNLLPKAFRSMEEIMSGVSLIESICSGSSPADFEMDLSDKCEIYETRRIIYVLIPVDHFAREILAYLADRGTFPCKFNNEDLSHFKVKWTEAIHRLSKSSDRRAKAAA